MEQAPCGRNPRLFAAQALNRGSYPTELREVLSVARAKESRALLSTWGGIATKATPLWAMPDSARICGVSEVWMKDESRRSFVGSFKALGAPVALMRLLIKLWPSVAPEEIFTGEHSDLFNSLVAISATDGNHGRALAAAAQSAGVRCVIVLHKNVSMEREQSIGALGATIVRVEGNYDDSVVEAARLAELNKWQVISDTSYTGYEEVPRDVMQGYGTIVDEVMQQTDTRTHEFAPFTHVVLQGGVGGLAAGIVSYFWEVFAEERPTFVVVEPHQADCLMQSAIENRPARSAGTVDSVMAGLACGEASPLAWRFLERSVDFFVTIADSDAVEAMRMLSKGSASEIPIVSGESGAAGLAALKLIAAHKALYARVGLTSDSRVLLINTEGATAPSVYKALTGLEPSDVEAAQERWLSMHRPP